MVPGRLTAVFCGPTYAFLHARVEPHMRPMATAIYMCVFNIAGVGIRWTVIGLASDTLFAGQRARSLGCAFLLVQIAAAWGGLGLLAGDEHYCAGSRGRAAACLSATAISPRSHRWPGSLVRLVFQVM